MPPTAADTPSHRFFLTAVAVLTVALLGFIALLRFPSDFIPPREAPLVRVHVSVPGVTAALVAEKITRPLEAALVNAANVVAVDSVTTSGKADLDLTVKRRRHVDALLQDINARLDNIKTSLPASLDKPEVSVIDASSVASVYGIVSRQHNSLALRDWVENELAHNLRELSGIARVDVEGGAVREVVVMPDQRRLAGYGLSLDDVFRAIRISTQANVGFRPTGGQDRRETMQSGNVAAVAAMPVLLPSGESIPLSEIARVTLDEETTPGPFRIDGDEAIKLTVYRQTQTNVTEVIERIHAHIEWMRANRLIPPGIGIQSLSPRETFGRSSLRQVTAAAITGVSLVLLTTFLMLGDGRRTLIVGVAILVAMQTIFVMMALSPLALNATALCGLVFGTGLFGGIAIMTFDAKAHSIASDDLYFKHIMATAFAVPLSLVPVMFSASGIGKFGEFTVIFGGGWLMSAFMALILVHSFEGGRRHRTPKRWHANVSHAISRVRRSYVGWLRRLLHFPNVTLAGALVLVGGFLSVPYLDKPSLPLLNEKPGEAIVMQLRGPEYPRLVSLGNELSQRLQAALSGREVMHTGQVLREETVLHLDEASAHEHGIDITQAGRALAIALDGISAGSFRDAAHRYEMKIHLSDRDTKGTKTPKRILLLGELNDRPAVYLHDVAFIEQAAVPSEIRRRNGITLIEIRVAPGNKPLTTAVSRQVSAMLSDFELPAEYQLSFGPRDRAAENYRRQGLIGIGSSLLLIFVFLALLYRSILLAISVTVLALISLAGIGFAMMLFGLSMTPPLWLSAMLLIGITAGFATTPARQFLSLRERGLALRKKIELISRRLILPVVVVVISSLAGMSSLLLIDNDTVNFYPMILCLAMGILFTLVAILLIEPVVCYIIRSKVPIAAERRPS